MKELRITNGRVIVDDDDYEWLKKHSWAINEHGYAVLVISATINSSMSMHRTIIKAHSGQIVDHVNGNKLDNRKENLRFCTTQQNQYNRGVNKNNKTGYKGVHNTPSGKFVALIKIDKKVKSLGTYPTAIEAAKVYNKYAIKYHGDFARLNNIQ